jgi:quinol monooxygenase YgiN
MGVMVIAAYRPKPGKAGELLALMKTHVPILRSQSLVADRPSYAMRSADGTILEVFEWKSQHAIDLAHTNPAVLAMWEKYALVCDYVPLNTIQECGDMFAGFEPIEL